MKKHRRSTPTSTYNLMDELMASDKAPMPETHRLHQLTAMHQALRALEQEEQPNGNDWRCLSDCPNLMETLVEMGVVEDADGLIRDAVDALALAGKRHRDGGALRLDGRGLQAIRGVLRDYGSVLDAVPHRTMIRCHRKTEQRIREICAGKRRAHDVEVIAL
jgi:hypothetical protein